jgi:4-carboxymuconolactone decarboxylase
MIGGPVTSKPLIPRDMETLFHVGYMTFGPGSRNKFHAHSSDQVLIITSGKGIVATEEEEVEVIEGDIIHSPAGEKHTHGATKDSHMTHIYIYSIDNKSIIYDE